MKYRGLLLLAFYISIFLVGNTIVSEVNAQVIQEESSDYHEIVLNNGVSDEYFDSVLEYWDMIPMSIRESMKADGWTVNATFKNLNNVIASNRIEGSLAEGFTDCDRGKIVIADRIASSILHEVGHYLDYKQGFCSSDLPDEVHQSEMENAMKVDSSRTAYAANYLTKCEYFASCFNLYIIKPDELKEMCPETYVFIEEHMVLKQKKIFR